MAPSASSHPSSVAVVQEVMVAPVATIAMAMHSFTHKHESIHGLLLGEITRTDDSINNKNNSSKYTIRVHAALPVCHGAPTMPMVELALGVAVSKEATVVGWYTAPMLLEDTQPGPVALRVAANLASSSSTATTDVQQPTVLLVLQNAVLTNQMAGGNHSGKATKQDATAAAPIFKALGRDFGDQWLDEITKCDIAQQEAITVMLQKQQQQQIYGGGGGDGTTATLPDLVDYLEDPSVEWHFPNPKVEELAKDILRKS
jgi:Uncharacterised protein family (UPF0172)